MPAVLPGDTEQLLVRGQRLCVEQPFDADGVAQHLGLLFGLTPLKRTVSDRSEQRAGHNRLDEPANDVSHDEQTDEGERGSHDWLTGTGR